MGEYVHDHGFGEKFLDTTPKVPSPKEKVDKFGFINIKTLALRKRLLRGGKDKFQVGRKYLQNNSLIKDL